MPSKLRTTLISALSVLFIFAGMAFAKTKKIDLIYQSTIGKSMNLKPGNYRVDVVKKAKTPTVKIYNRYGKLMGQTPVKLVNESRKNSQTEVDYVTVASNDHTVTEISPRGWKENIYFPHTKTSKATPKKK